MQALDFTGLHPFFGAGEAGHGIAHLLSKSEKYLSLFFHSGAFHPAASVFVIPHVLADRLANALLWGDFRFHQQITHQGTRCFRHVMNKSFEDAPFDLPGKSLPLLLRAGNRVTGNAQAFSHRFSSGVLRALSLNTCYQKEMRHDFKWVKRLNIINPKSDIFNMLDYFFCGKHLFVRMGQQ